MAHVSETLDLMEMETKYNARQHAKDQNLKAKQWHRKDPKIKDMHLQMQKPITGT